MPPVAMHAKSDSDVTCSVDGAPFSPTRSPRRPLYYVQSPSNQDFSGDKMSFGSSPAASPVHHHHHYYHCSPIHHSRESSTSRFSAASLKQPRRQMSWLKLQPRHEESDVEHDEDEDDGAYGHRVRPYVCFFFLFIVMFTAFSLILWGASKSYRPVVVVKTVVLENFNVQAGNDESGVPTDMLSLNSTVRIFYRNPASFFGVHVTSSPLQLHYFQLLVASGHMNEFYESRTSERTVVTVLSSHQVALYGGISVLNNARAHLDTVAVPLNLTVVVRSRANILGQLVKSKFDRKIRCLVTLRGNKLGHPVDATNLCTYHP